MPDGIHRFSVGTFNLIAIDDESGAVDADGDGWTESPFVNATTEEVRRVFDAHREGPNAWTNAGACTCLVIDTGKNRVLVDTGSGQQALPNSGLLLQRLAEAGVTPESIDIVILTHGHYDHIGANATDGRPTFSNARYLMTLDEFRHWTEVPSPFGGEIDEQGRSYATANLTAIRDRFTFVESEGELLPGIRAMPAPGHTPGQIALLIEDGRERLLCTADTFHHPCELVEPDWYFDFDHDPAVTVSTRRRILDWAAREDILVHVYHCPFPGLGRIVRDSDHWEWVRP